MGQINLNFMKISLEETYVYFGLDPDIPKDLFWKIEIKRSKIYF